MLNEVMIDFEDLNYNFENDSYWYENKPFTGTATSFYNGKLYSIDQYVDGYEHGISKTFYKSSKLEKQVQMKYGNVHGTKRIWYENGVLKSESSHARGILLERKSWDKEGNLIEEYQLPEDDLMYSIAMRPLGD
jgi:antitoxin component YwqK of YwqJK toxin-antitoxin module